jgi:phosphoglycolate phosphatase-like HAD superfamily hydrolase
VALLLPGTAIEVVRAFARPARVRAALLDFDGTLSLIRAGWQDVMTGVMVDELRAMGTGESETALAGEMAALIHRLTGEPTIAQMRGLADAVAARGGTPADAETYKARYLERLTAVVGERRSALASGRVPPDTYLLPGARALLGSLRARGVALCLASGTDDGPLREEAALLGIDGCFDLGIHGARDGFSKGRLVDDLVAKQGIPGSALLAIGDGPVELVETCRVGGIAVGVASDEHLPGRLDGAKRERLVSAGAHVIVPDLAEQATLLHYLLDDPGGR